MPEQITFYSAKVCPWAQRVELALEEAKADHTKYWIDLKNKPEWFAPRVNALSKVPVISYGGPKVAPEDPSPESQKLNESAVLLEFIADLYPESGLLPQDPVQRARARLFIDTFSVHFLPAYNATLRRGEAEAIFKGVTALQSLLPEEGKGKFALGDTFSIADAAVAPFVGRLEVALTNDAGAYAQGEGPKIYKVLETDPKYARFKQYFHDIKSRESYKKTFHVDIVVPDIVTRFTALRAPIQSQ